MPLALVEVLKVLRPDSDWGGLEPYIDRALIPGAFEGEFRRRYAGFCVDSELRKTIELAAVEQATSHYSALGFTVEDVGATHSFDLRVIRCDEERHVEVKGSQGTIETIHLTRNEVEHANKFSNTDLITVAEIPWEQTDERSYRASGDGIMTVVPNWNPSPENLKASSYTYFLD